MASYIYNKSIIISGEMVANQLQDDINNDILISKNCSRVDTTPTTLTCFFDEVLTNEEQTVLENLVINFIKKPLINIVEGDAFQLDNKIQQVCKFIKNDMLLEANIKTPIGGGWTHVIGNLEGFDASTGNFVCPSDGIYFYNLLISTTSQTTNTEIIIDVKDEFNNITFGTTETLNTHQTISRVFLGNGVLLFSGNEIKFDLLVPSSNVNVNIEFKMIRLLC